MNDSTVLPITDGQMPQENQSPPSAVNERLGKNVHVFPQGYYHSVSSYGIVKQYELRPQLSIADVKTEDSPGAINERLSKI